MAISVVIADDHAVVRRGLRALLEAERGVSIAGEAVDGHEALAAVERHRPDVLVLDLMMPAMRGAEVLREIAVRRLPTRVVVLSMHATDAHVAEAVRLGATGYVAKDAAAGDLVRAVRAAAAGKRFLSAALTGDAIEYGRRDEATPRLTSREEEVLALAAHGYTNQEIAERLSIGRRTAESHRANLMRKLALRNQRDLIAYAVRHKIVQF